MSEIILVNEPKLKKIIEEDNLDGFISWLSNKEFFLLENVEMKDEDIFFFKDLIYLMIENGSLKIFKFLINSPDFEPVMGKINTVETLCHVMTLYYNIEEQYKYKYDYDKKTDIASEFTKLVQKISGNEENFQIHINAYNIHGTNAFQDALMTGNTDIIEFFIREGIDIKQTNKLFDREFPLIALPIISENKDVISNLIMFANIYNINTFDLFNNKKFIDYLNAKGVDIDIKDDEGEIDDLKKTNLIDFLCNNVKDIKNFLTENVINMPSLLSKAVFEDNLMLARFLVEKCGVNITDTTIEYNNFSKKEILLYNVLEKSYASMIQFLIKKGININMVVDDKFKSKPLHIVSQCSPRLIHNTYAIIMKMNIIQFLINNNANINVLDKNECNSLHYACCSGAPINIIQFLINNGINLDAVDVNGYSSLHYACANDNYIDVVKYLVESGANTTKVDKNGRTPLQYAINMKCPAIVKYLTPVVMRQKERKKSDNLLKATEEITQKTIQNQHNHNK